jgi:hypothetical protein
MKKLFKFLCRFYDKLFPPIKFKKKYFKDMTIEEADDWAEKMLEKFEQQRRNKRGTRN